MGQESAFHRFTTQPLEVEQQPPQQQPLPDFSATSELADDGAPAAPPKPPFKRKLTRIIAVDFGIASEQLWWYFGAHSFPHLTESSIQQVDISYGASTRPIEKLAIDLCHQGLLVLWRIIRQANN
jgi:hypothetical protein